MRIAALETRTSDLAAELARRGARFTIVGSTAHRMAHPGASRPRDLDVVVAPCDAPGLAAALRDLGAVTTTARILRGNPTTVATAWCPLDVFVDRYR